MSAPTTLLPVLPAEAPAREIVRNYPWPGFALWRGQYWRMAGTP